MSFYKLLGLALLATPAMTTTYDPINQMCYRWKHQSVIKDNTLFIDGGLETFSNNPSANGPNNILGYNNVLIEVPMTDSWDWKVNITELAIAKTENTNTGTYPPSLWGGAMFSGNSNEDLVFTFAGTYFDLNSTFGSPSPDPPTYTLWSYDKSSNSWDQYDISLVSTVRPSNGAYADAPDQSLGFYLGGELDQSSQQGLNSLGNNTIPIAGMIVINMTVAEPSAMNVSTDPIASGEAIIGSSLSYIPEVGPNGILVAMGGVTKPAATPVLNNGTLIPFDTVDVLDISTLYNNGTPKWYKQQTSGMIPPGRVDSCVVQIAAQDNSSYNLYLYGGRDPTNGTLFDDIYALSLPSFTWVQLYEGSSPRYGHTCHVVGNRQLLTVGGNLSNNITKGCDWELKGVAILDLSTMDWGSVYNSFAPAYEVTPGIVSVIGGSPQGGATLKAPTSGFADPDLSSLFSRSPTTTSTNTTAEPSAEPSSEPSTSKKSNAGVIAGGIIGVLFGVALLIGGLYFCLRRRVVKFAGIPYIGQRAPNQAELEGGQVFEKGIPEGELPASSIFYELSATDKPPELEGD